MERDSSKFTGRLAVDFPWDSSAHMGTGAYSETMVRALALAAPNLEISLIVSQSMPQSISYPNVRYVIPQKTDWGPGEHRLQISATAEGLRAHCLFAPATLLPATRSVPMVTTVHDLTFIENPQFYSEGLTRHLNQWFQPSLRLADQIVAISDITKCKLIETMSLSESKITVIQQPVREPLNVDGSTENTDRVLHEFRIESPFFFHVSNLAPHKNLAFLIQVFYAYLKRNPQSKQSLVIAGGGVSPNMPTDFNRIAADAGIQDRVKYIGRIDDNQLRLLYKSCDAFLFPSLAEGWGLPVAEAAACGASIYTTSNVPAAEFAISSIVLPLEMADWIDALEKPKQRCTWSGSSMQRAGNELAQLIQSVIEGTTKARTPHINGFVLSAPWGLGDSLLLTALAKCIKGCLPERKIWIDSWPGDLPLPDFIEQGTAPSHAKKVIIGYGQPHELADSSEFPGSLIRRMAREFTTKSGIHFEYPAKGVRPAVGFIGEMRREKLQIAIMAHGTGATPSKEWGYESFAALSQLLIKAGWEVVQIGGLVDQQINGIRDERSNSLRHAATVLASSALFVGEVGFLMHLAAAVQTPSIIIYGGREIPEISGYPENVNIVADGISCKGKWGCWLDNHVLCPYAHECMTAITPELVSAIIDSPPFNGMQNRASKILVKATAGGTIADRPSVQRRSILLSGCMVIKNGIKLGYPFVEAVQSIIDFVDEMIIVDGGSGDGTWNILAEMARVCSKVVIRCEPWPKVNTSGQIIAIATNAALKHCRGTHILYLQADEIHTEVNLQRLRDLLSSGYDSAAFPFLHFRTSWWTVSANPAYAAAVRCIPNKAGVTSIMDACTFAGPIEPCAHPKLFPDCIFHVGWVYEKNVIEKHKNHAKIYVDNPSYTEKAKRASEFIMDGAKGLEFIDNDYSLTKFTGKHPHAVQHLLGLPEYQCDEGLRKWKSKFSAEAPQMPCSKVGSFFVIRK